MKPRRQSGRNVRGHGEHRDFSAGGSAGSGARGYVLTTMVVRRGGLDRHEPHDTMRSELNAGGPTAAFAAASVVNRSMCQTNGALRPGGSGLFSTRLQPISPDVQVSFRRSLAPIAPTPSALNK